MKRDWDVVRNILLAVEAAPIGQMIYDNQLTDVAPLNIVQGHIALLAEGQTAARRR